MNNKAVAFLRVSTDKQYNQGDSPDEQLESIQFLLEKYQANLVNTFTFHESAGKEKQPLEEILPYCIENNIDFVFLKNIDRLTRAGELKYLTLFKKFKDNGIKIFDSEEVISHEIKNTLENHNVKYEWSEYRPTEEQEIRKAQEAENEKRRILTRMIGAEIRYSRLGYWIGGSIYGYTHIKENTEHGRRSIVYPLDEEAKYIKMMFDLKESGIFSKEIVQIVNEAGFKTRQGKPLTVKQLDRFLENPSYCLIRTIKRQSGRDNRGKKLFSPDAPVRIKGKAIISDEQFNSVNVDKLTIIDDSGKIHLLKGKRKQIELFKRKDNPQYPFKHEVLCPVCKRDFEASASRGRTKTYPAYHCNRGHKLYRVPQDVFHETIRNFIRNVKLEEHTIVRIKESYYRQSEAQRTNALDNTVIIQKKIDEKIVEQQALIDKIPMLNSSLVIKSIEDKISAIELEIVLLQKSRNKQENIKTNTQEEISKFFDWLESPEKLIFDEKNSLRGAKFFGVMFNEKPTYEELLNPTARTVKLAWILKQKDTTNTDCDLNANTIEPFLAWIFKLMEAYGYKSNNPNDIV